MTNDTRNDLVHPQPRSATLPYYTFRTTPYEYRNCEEWPAQHAESSRPPGLVSHLSAVEAENRANEIALRFDRLQRGIKVYLSSGSLKMALHEAQCSREVFYRQFNRCLLPNPLTGEGIVGWSD
jgi:hypothetical protein